MSPTESDNQSFIYLLWHSRQEAKEKSESFPAFHFLTQKCVCACVCVCGVCVCLVAQLCLTLCDPMDYSPPGYLCSWGVSRQEYCSGLPCPSPGELPDPGIEPRSPVFQEDSLQSESPRKLLLQKGTWQWPDDLQCRLQMRERDLSQHPLIQRSLQSYRQKKKKQQQISSRWCLGEELILAPERG